jgi:peptidoglycan LD-endopeptidase CwlK
MPRFGRESLRQLATCDARLQRIMHEAIQVVDFSVTEGHRDKAAQNAAVARGASTLRWPKGNHNKLPSRAVDFSPYPVDWSENAKAIARFAFVAGVIAKAAHDLGVKVRFGWDWNRNLDPRDESFMDWPHVELDEP